MYACSKIYSASTSRQFSWYKKSELTLTTPSCASLGTLNVPIFWGHSESYQSTSNALDQDPTARRGWFDLNPATGKRAVEAASAFVVLTLVTCFRRRVSLPTATIFSCREPCFFIQQLQLSASHLRLLLL